MEKFTQHNPTRIHFGEDQFQHIATEIPADANVLFIYGGGSIKSNGVYDHVVSALSEHTWVEFSGIEPNPQYDTLIKALDLIKEHSIDYLLAVGGGSVIDGSKFIAAAAYHTGDDPWDILAKEAEITKTLPLGCVLTLPATGTESNGNSVVSRGKDKLAFGNDAVRPQFAILDPATTLTLSDRQIGNGVVDAFVHIMEQYLTYPVNAKVQDRFAESLLQILIEEGPKALNPKTKEDLGVRANIMWCATQALNGSLNPGVPQDWSTHMIGHELTGAYNIDHARTLSIVLPAVMKVKTDKKKEKILQYGERVWQITRGSEEERIAESIAKTEAFFSAMGLPIRLSEVDLAGDDITHLVNAIETHGYTSLGEHGDITPSVVREILETAQ